MPGQVSASGIVTDAVTGERHIPASTRPDGSQRREIRIRPGYRPPEDVELYKNRAAAAWRNRGAAGVPGAEGLKESKTASSGTATTASANKNAKRREAKRRAKAAEAEGQGAAASKPKGGALDKDNWRSGAPANEEEEEEKKKNKEAEPVDPEVEKEKKARALKKKLRQARELRDKKDKGENLLPEQLEKVIRINELIRQLDALGFDADGERKQPPTDKEEAGAASAKEDSAV
ncbi:hypothetical protein VTO42DRAFT_1498 [Malbranchea cinnamomea]